MPVSPLFALAFVAPTAHAGALTGVTPCDLKQVAGWYGTSIAGAKKTLKRNAKGSKVIDTEYGPMNESVYYEVSTAQKVAVKCRFDETHYTYDDAVLLAQVWGTDPLGAKAIVEEKISYGNGLGVVWALSDARKGMFDQKYEPAGDPDGPALEAFWASDPYTYCDARIVSEVWQTDVYSAKVNIGYKLLNQDRPAIDALEQSLMQGRQRALSQGRGCEFVETDYSYDDAAQLAQVWHVSVEAAKARVADMVTRGQNRAVLQALGRG